MHNNNNNNTLLYFIHRCVYQVVCRTQIIRRPSTTNSALYVSLLYPVFLLWFSMAQNHKPLNPTSTYSNPCAEVESCAHLRSLTDLTHTPHTQGAKPELAAFTVWPFVVLWWDTQADKSGPEIPPLCVWSQAAEAAGGCLTRQMEECGQRVVPGAWLQTRWGTRDLLAGQVWPLPRTQQAPDAVLRFLWKHSGMKRAAVYAKRNGPRPL